jgi:hypothetical protein
MQKLFFMIATMVLLIVSTSCSSTPIEATQEQNISEHSESGKAETRAQAPRFCVRSPTETEHCDCDVVVGCKCKNGRLICDMECYCQFTGLPCGTTTKDFGPCDAAEYEKLCTGDLHSENESYCLPEGAKKIPCQESLSQ